MKIKNLVLLLAVLALAACAQPAGSEPLTTTPAPASPATAAVVTQAEAINKAAVISAEVVDKAVVAQAEVTNKIEAICIRNSEETRLLINDIQKYCLQYPVGYDIAIENGVGIALFKRSVLNPEDPSVFITVEAADGRTVEQVADQLIADYSVPGLEVTRVSLEIDQEQAIMLDGLTGESLNRHVVVLHNENLYHMTIMPMDGSPDVRAQAEVLYNTLIQSFNFRPETNLCPDCPPPTDTP